MIDCTILTFKKINYLLPTLAISQAMILPENMKLNQNVELAGHYVWQDQDMPIVTLDKLPLADTILKHPKIALLHSMPPLKENFAVLFTEQARRLKISQDNIVWANEDKTQALITDKKVQIAVFLVDIADLSLHVNQLISVSAQIAK